MKKNIIISPDNPKVKELVRLRNSNYRRGKGLFIIEGQRELLLALGSRVGIKEIFFCPEFLSESDIAKVVSLSLKRAIPVVEVNKKVHSKIAFGKRQEGLVAIARQTQSVLGGIRLGKNPLIVVLESVEKPGNLGAVIRTIDAAGADGLIVANPLADVYNPNVVRSSLGTLFKIALAESKSEEALSWLKKNGLEIVCAVVGAKVNYTMVNFNKPCAIIFGSEENGLSRIWLDNADISASIPMRGSANSLNISIAAAAFIFEAVRQRGL